MNFWLDEDGRLRLAWRIVLSITLTFAVSEIALWIGYASGRSERSVDAAYRPALVLLLLGVYCAMLLFADRIEHNPLSALGLGRRHAVKLSVFGIVLGCAMISAGVGGIAIVGRISWRVHWDAGVAGLVIAELWILISAALAEELMFRGYPFQRLVDGLGPWGAVLLMSALFAAAHLENPHASVWSFTNTVAVGVLLSLAYLRTRSLWLPWGIHFGWNFALGLGFGLPVSGLTSFAVAVHGRAAGPAWLTGGAYGLEGGALGTLAIALGFLPLIWLTRHPLPREGDPCSQSPSAAPAASN